MFCIPTSFIGFIVLGLSLAVMLPASASSARAGSCALT
jgi:hypothetical protein